MMLHVAGDHPRQRTDSHMLVAGDPAPGPGLFGQRIEQVERRRSHLGEFADQATEVPPIIIGVLDRHILVESRQRPLESTREPEGPEAEDPLGVGDVTNQLTNAPLPFRLAMAREGVRNIVERRTNPVGLVVEELLDITGRHACQVTVVELGDFI